MPTTRSGTRKVEDSSPAPSASTTGSKRKATETSPPSKKGRQGAPKKQKKIEETLPGIKDMRVEEDDEKQNDFEMKGTEETEMAEMAEMKDEEPKEEEKVEEPEEEENDAKDSANTANGAANGAAMTSETDKAKEENNGQVAPKDEAADGDAVEKSAEREKTTPSNIMEKGIIYFFSRGRVGINEPSSVDEIARSYIVLRPIPHGAKLGDGPMGDAGKNRVLALPKKVLPKSPKDRFMVFVEKANCSIEDIKKDFLSASDYTTKTAGTRHTPQATPIAEGVYAIISTGRESHLAYILTLPSEVSEVQKDIGLNNRGSFVASLRNPQYDAPAVAQLPKSPEYPQEYDLSSFSLRPSLTLI